MAVDDEYNAGARDKVIVQSEIRESVICRRSAAGTRFYCILAGTMGRVEVLIISCYCAGALLSCVAFDCGYWL